MGLPHLHFAHDSASLATACSPSTTRLMEYSSISFNFATGSQFPVEPHVDVLGHRPLSTHRKKSHEHPRALAQPLLSWQTPQELDFVVLRHSPSSPLLPPSLLFLFTRPDRPLPNGCASGRNFLLMASSSLSGLALPMKLSSSISRGNVVRRRRTHQE